MKRALDFYVFRFIICGGVMTATDYVSPALCVSASNTNRTQTVSNWNGITENRYILLKLLSTNGGACVFLTSRRRAIKINDICVSWETRHFASILTENSFLNSFELTNRWKVKWHDLRCVELRIFIFLWHLNGMTWIWTQTPLPLMMWSHLNDHDVGHEVFILTPSAFTRISFPAAASRTRKILVAVAVWRLATMWTAVCCFGCERKWKLKLMPNSRFRFTFPHLLT